MSRVVHHVFGQLTLGGELTACGKSTHFYQGPRTPTTSTNKNEVTCKRCLKKLAEEKAR